jgi:uncharacterized membrane protein YhaH (DUF805 family)
MSFTQAIRSVYRNYATFSGRAPRSEYWWFQLFLLLVVFGWLFAVAAFGTTGYSAINLLLVFGVAAFFIASIVPGIAVAVRRLHVSDKSGWWILVSFLPYVGGIAC